MAEKNPVPAAGDGFKRTLLLAIIAMSVLGTVVGWYIQQARGVMSPPLRVVLAGSTVVLSGLFVAAWVRALPQRAIELCCLLYAVIVCAVCMALGLYSTRYRSSFDLQPLYLWIPIGYVFSFTLTNYRVGLMVSLAIMLVFVGVSAPYLIHDISGPDANFTVQLHVMSGALIATLYFFSRYQYRLRQVQATVGQLSQLSNTDDLTQLSNRRRMAAELDAELARGETGRGDFAVFLFDVDHFKAVNDQFGHAVGDDVLMKLGARASRLFRGCGELGRWGGDEFVALVRDVEFEDAARMANALCTLVAAEPLHARHALTISCGVTMARPDDSLDSLLQRADAALYAAKHAGRNRAECVVLDAARTGVVA